MGNLSSIHKINYMNNKNDNCLLCNKKTEKHNLVQCHRCRIKLHDYCYDIHSAERTYAVCPNPKCQEVGALGQELYYKNKYLEKQQKQKHTTKE